MCERHRRVTGAANQPDEEELEEDSGHARRVLIGSVSEKYASQPRERLTAPRSTGLRRHCASGRVKLVTDCLEAVALRTASAQVHRSGDLPATIRALPGARSPVARAGVCSGTSYFTTSHFALATSHRRTVTLRLVPIGRRAGQLAGIQIDDQIEDGVVNQRHSFGVSLSAVSSRVWIVRRMDGANPGASPDSLPPLSSSQS